MSIDYMSLDEAMGDKWRPGVHYVEQAQVRISILSAEVRRLRAMLEPTPDARELAIRVSRTVERGYWSSEPDDVSLTEVVALISAYRARLLDEAAERIRAEKVDAEATGDEGDIAYNCAIDDAVRALYESDAIKGAAHE